MSETKQRALGTKLVTERVRKPLWSRAHNQCAFPGCIQALTVDVEDARSGAAGITVIGQEAHIRARSVGGPRYDASYTEVDGYENLVLLCPTHHTMIDANNGAGYTVEALLRMKRDHERNQERLEDIQRTLRAYLGDRYAAENSVQFQQADLHAPSVDAMFVDVPVGCRRDGSALAELLQRISESAPGDTAELEQASGLLVTGATQALLHPDWAGNAILVGGPGQGKSTILQYVCQFHRARRLSQAGYFAEPTELIRTTTTARFPIRIDLRKYALWATSAIAISGKKGKKRNQPQNSAATWRSLEEYIIDDISRHIGANEFARNELALLLVTEPVLLALDGLDEVASLPLRARVIEEIVRMRGRVAAEAADLVILVATRPGTSLQPLTSSGAFPVLHLQRLTHGLRLQYLDQWCRVSELAPEAATKLQTTFMNSQHVHHIKELASYPMQLAILLHLLYRRQLLPQQRTELYEEYLKTFLDREQSEDKEPLLADKRRVIEDTHAYLGWYLQTKAEQGQTAGSVTREELRGLLRTYLAGRPKEQELADELYSAITDRVLCLVERDDAFEFEVQSLREYFAALHIFDNLTPKGNGNSRDDGLNALLVRPYWANVCRFFIGKLARGEIRGLISNFQEVEKKIAPHPLVRAMAVTVLNDRIYDGLASSEIQEVVDFILGGPGVVLGQDGTLDPAGNPLLLGEEAGRAQAVSHLKSRLEVESDTLLQDSLSRSLATHQVPNDALGAWWWKRFEPTSTWMRTAVNLRILAGLTLEETTQLKAALAATEDSQSWVSNWLVDGGFDGTDDAIVQMMIEDLNEGGAEEAQHPLRDTDAHVLAHCASVVLAGPFAAPQRISPQRASGMHSNETARIQQTTQLLQNSPPHPTSATEWENYLTVVADTWGDGWLLRRAVSVTPSTMDLPALATRTQCLALASATRAEANYRGHKSDAVWWRGHLGAAANTRELMLGVLALLKNAKSAVIVDLAPVLDDAVKGLDAKRYRTLERALRRDSTWHSVRPLDLQEALRLRTVSLSGRVLWLVRIVANESTRERIPTHLRDDIEDVFLAGTVYGREVATAAQTSRKLKLDIFSGARGSFPSGDWHDGSQLVSMTIKMATNILERPGDWPAHLVQAAVDRISLRTSDQTSPLAEIATANRWFRA